MNAEHRTPNIEHRTAKRIAHRCIVAALCMLAGVAMGQDRVAVTMDTNGWRLVGKSTNFTAATIGAPTLEQATNIALAVSGGGPTGGVSAAAVTGIVTGATGALATAISAEIGVSGAVVRAASYPGLGTVAVAAGGTGATTASGALSNLTQSLLWTSANTLVIDGPTNDFVNLVVRGDEQAFIDLRCTKTSGPAAMFYRRGGTSYWDHGMQSDTHNGWGGEHSDDWELYDAIGGIGVLRAQVGTGELFAPYADGGSASNLLNQGTMRQRFLVSTNPAWVGTASGTINLTNVSGAGTAAALNDGDSVGDVVRWGDTNAFGSFVIDVSGQLSHQSAADHRGDLGLGSLATMNYAPTAATATSAISVALSGVSGAGTMAARSTNDFTVAHGNDYRLPKRKLISWALGNTTLASGFASSVTVGTAPEGMFPAGTYSNIVAWSAWITYGTNDNATVSTYGTNIQVQVYFGYGQGYLTGNPTAPIYPSISDAAGITAANAQWVVNRAPCSVALTNAPRSGAPFYPLIIVRNAGPVTVTNITAAVVLEVE